MFTHFVSCIIFSSLNINELQWIILELLDLAIPSKSLELVFWETIIIYVMTLVTAVLWINVSALTC